jgi:hypothetical protein
MIVVEAKLSAASEVSIPYRTAGADKSSAVRPRADLTGRVLILAAGARSGLGSDD